jgi:alpha-tubulin suppressor-like RCC1 family protein
MYSFGNCEFGQLGHGSFDCESSPKIVDALRHVRIATPAAGRFHSRALSDDGTVYSWGFVRPPGGHSRGREPLPQKVEALRGLCVCSLVTSQTASYVVTTLGELFTWGHGNFGQLGHGDFASELVPRRVDALDGEWVVAVAASGSHTIVVTRGGSVFGWGNADALGIRERDAATTRVVYGHDCFCSPVRYTELRCASVRSP